MGIDGRRFLGPTPARGGEQQMGQELEEVALAQPFAPSGLLLRLREGRIALEMDGAEAGLGVPALGCMAIEIDQIEDLQPGRRG